jgi:hypothetical protein
MHGQPLCLDLRCAWTVQASFVLGVLLESSLVRDKVHAGGCIDPILDVLVPALEVHPQLGALQV